MSVAVWIGGGVPVRTIRWLDGALATAAMFPGATAIAAGDLGWLELAADRASRAKLACIGIATELSLDYLGWAQIVVAGAKKVGATTVLVDEASRPERFAEVAAIADLLEAVQLTNVVSLSRDGEVLRATRATRGELQTYRVRGDAVIGLRIAGPKIDEYPTPMPSAALKRFDLPALGLDPSVLAHRAVPPRTTRQPRRTLERVADLLAVHVTTPRTGAS
ncbi:MAG: hypothetical protein SFX73_05610 [Kofleriaceae bacterium]|nr:hypothetical protein [Kofleriaceae bacterium]